MIEKIQDGIYRIIFPFDNIYTSSFILTENNNAIIFDSGYCDEDAEKYIIPEAKKLNVNVKYLVSSHTHGDHYGGIKALKKAFPCAVSALFSKDAADSRHLTDGEILLNRFQMLNLKGHTDDSLAIFDLETKILFSADCLQLYGVDKYKTLVSDRDEYLKSIERVRAVEPDMIIASHDYEPLGYMAKKDIIREYLDTCIRAVE